MGAARIGLHRSQHSTEFAVMPTGRGLRGIIIISLDLHNVLIGQAKSVVPVIVVVLHLHALLPAVNIVGFRPSEKLKPRILDLSPMDFGPIRGQSRSYRAPFDFAQGGELALRGIQGRESNRTVEPQDTPRIKIRNRKLEIRTKLKYSNPNYEQRNR